MLLPTVHFDFSNWLPSRWKACPKFILEIRRSISPQRLEGADPTNVIQKGKGMSSPKVMIFCKDVVCRVIFKENSCYCF